MSLFLSMQVYIDFSHFKFKIVSIQSDINKFCWKLMLLKGELLLVKKSDSERSEM